MYIRTFKFAAVAAAACFFACSCGKETIEPSFPESLGDVPVVSTEETITFTPNMDWELSVPNETIAFFWIVDEEKGNVNRIKGKASDKPVTVKIGITDEPDFNDDIKCAVTLVMGGKEKVVAEYTLLKSVRTFNAYPCQIDATGLIRFKDEGGLDFSEEDSDDVVVSYHRTLGFAAPVKLSAGVNYDMIQAPEWIDVSLYSTSDVALGSRGECQALFKIKEGTEYPTTETLTGTVVFSVRRNSQDILKTLNISFRPVTDFISWEGDAEVFFDGNGVYGGDMTEGQTAYSGDMFSSEGVVFFAAANFQKEGMGGTFWTGTDVDWVTITDSPWEEGAGVLQRRKVQISMQPNTGAERTADIYAIPASLASSIARGPAFDTATHPLNSDYDDVKAEIKPYKIMTLVQDVGGELVRLDSPASGVEFSEVASEYFNPDGNAMVMKYAIILQYSIESLYSIKTSSDFSVSLAKTPGRVVAQKYVPGPTPEEDQFEDAGDLFEVQLEGSTAAVKVKSTEAVEGVLVFQTADLMPIAALWIEYTPAN